MAREGVKEYPGQIKHQERMLYVLVNFERAAEFKLITQYYSSRILSIWSRMLFANLRVSTSNSLDVKMLRALLRSF